MKKLFTIFACLVVLAGCTTSKQPSEPTPESADDVAVSERILAENISGPGGVCGGPDNKKCNAGLLCEYNTSFPKAQGICFDSVEDKTITCAKDREPVCGMLRGQKHGFLNECELKRHGAVFVSKGFCSIDVNVAGNCKAKGTGIGTCTNTVESYEFDGTSCVKKYISGCESEVPFTTLQECQNTCQ